MSDVAALLARERGRAPSPTFRMGEVMAISPFAVRFGATPDGDVVGLARMTGYTPQVGDVVLVAVLHGGGLCVLGRIASGTQQESWLPSTTRDAMGFAAYSQTHFGQAEAWLGRQVNRIQLFYAGNVATSMTAGASSFDAIVDPAHWTRAGGRTPLVTISGPLVQVSSTTKSTWPTNVLQAHVEGNLYESYFRARGAALTAAGFDTPYPDGQWKGAIRFGVEANIGNSTQPLVDRFFPHQFWNDSTADWFRQRIDQVYGWMKAEMDHPENVGWLMPFHAKETGTFARLGIALGSTCTGVDGDHYLDHWRYGGAGTAPNGGKTPDEKRDWDSDVRSRLFDGECGLWAILEVARTAGLLFTATETGCQIRLPQGSSGDSGSGDAPGWPVWFDQFLRDGPLADGRLLSWLNTFSNAAGGGTFINRWDDARLAEAGAVFHGLYV